MSAAGTPGGHTNLASQSASMKIFEPHVHMFSRITDDYERMREAGIVAINEPAFWLGQPRTSVATFKDYFDTLIGWERYRASQFGIKHFCCMALNPKEANDDRVNQGVVEELLPIYLEKDGVIGVGEVGFDDMTATEERWFRRQVELAFTHELPVLIHTPHRDKRAGVERTIALIRELGVDQTKVLIDHNTEETIHLVKEQTECWAGFTIYPTTKMSQDRMIEVFRKWGTERMMVNSSADWGTSNPLNVPRLARRMLDEGFEPAEVARVVWDNPTTFFGQSGRLDLEDIGALEVDEAALYAGNTIKRS